MRISPSRQMLPVGSIIDRCWKSRGVPEVQDTLGVCCGADAFEYAGAGEEVVDSVAGFPAE
jgi:hypothetical protein